MLRLPGLIDPHVHLRTPGQEEKEDFLTGTSAALAGGYTTIIDMPNNVEPITTLQRLQDKQNTAKEQIVCDVGFYFGSTGDNLDQFPLIQDKVLGLKVYLNQTTGGFIVDEKVFEKICEAWPIGKPILVHAEEDVLEQAITIAHTTGQRLHIAHVSSENELRMILAAKMKGYQLTCGVTPHHLFLTQEDATRLGNFGLVKPSLKTQQDQDFLWQHLKDIDVIESDHAPHTKEEKEHGAFGLPGLETTLPLLLTAASQNRITIKDIQRLCHDRSKSLFFNRHPELVSGSQIEIDENEEWTIENGKLFTKCNWSPFNGWNVKGKVKSVFIRETKVFENDKILTKPGTGTIL